jgi:hypothetical protein
VKASVVGASPLRSTRRWDPSCCLLRNGRYHFSSPGLNSVQVARGHCFPLAPGHPASHFNGRTGHELGSMLLAASRNSLARRRLALCNSEPTSHRLCDSVDSARALVLSRRWNMRSIYFSSGAPSKNGRWQVRLDRFTHVNELVEGFSSDDVATTDSDSLQSAIKGRFFDSCALTRTICSG